VHPVGVDDLSVEVEVRHPLGVGALEGIVEVRGLGREGLDHFIEVAVGGRLGQAEP
jgi:hypothetical protein